MVRRSLLACIVATLVGVCISAPAAVGDERADRRAKRVEALRRDLRSDEPEAVAQAAFEAGGLYRSRTALIPNLLTALKHDKRSEASHGSRVVKHLLDALIRLDAKVPMAVLRPLEEPVDTATEALVLATRNGRAADPLLRRAVKRAIDGREIGVAGIAAGNLLAAAKDKHLCPLFLPHLRPSVSITVFDHDRLGGGSTSVGSCTGCARCKIPKGFPPAVWYELSFAGRDRQRSLVAKGAVESVWYVRHEESRREFFGCHSRRERDATRVGFGWIATMLGVRLEDLQLKPRLYRSHRWSTPDAYRTHVRDVRAEIQREAGVVLDRLVKARLLTVEDRRSVVIDPIFEIKDDRDDRGVPLPGVEGARER